MSLQNQMPDSAGTEMGIKGKDLRDNPQQMGIDLKNNHSGIIPQNSAKINSGGQKKLEHIKTDMNEVKRTLSVLKSGELVEIRMLKSKMSTSGYFKGDYANLLKGLEYAGYDNCYMTLNAIRDECYSREQNEKYIGYAKTQTGDADISHRQWILVDADPKRASGISSTDEEKEYARLVMQKVYNYLHNMGFEPPVCADSGNGYHQLYRVEVANDTDTTKIIQGFLKYLDLMFSDDRLSIDTGVYNASRITKLYGTVARKGANTPERPHRLSHIIEVPDEIKATDMVLIKKVADMLPEPPPKQEYINHNNSGNSGNFDIQGFINKYLRTSKIVNTGGYTKYLLEECPFDASHKSPDSMITINGNGAVGFKCLHGSCSNYKWENVRELYEPKQNRQSNRYNVKTPPTTDDIFDEFEASGEPNVWEMPIPFESVALPFFPVNELPVIVSDIVRAVAETTQTSPDMAAAASLAILAVCLQGKYIIEGKKDWREPINLYILIIADPAERKSAVLKHIAQPVTKYEREENIRIAPLIEQNKMDKAILQNRKKILETKSAKSSKDIDYAQIRELAEEISSFREINPLRLFYDDITTQKLAEALSDNDGRAAIISSEGGIFDILAGKYSNNVPDIDIFLKAHSSDSIRIDRIGRGSNTVENPVLTTLLSVQPNIIENIISNPAFQGRGLCARFLYAIPTSKIGTRNYNSSPIPEITMERYNSLIKCLLSLNVNKAEPDILTLSEKAKKAMNEFADRIEKMLIEELSDIRAFGGKICGAVLRIAGLLHIVNCADNINLEVCESEMLSAVKIGEYFIAHAKAAYKMMAADENAEKQKQAEYVLEKIISNKLEQFKKSDILRRFCRKFDAVEQLTEPINILIQNYYLKEAPQKYNGVGRRPENIYHVNPHIYK